MDDVQLNIQSDAQADQNKSFEALHFVGMSEVQSNVLIPDLDSGKMITAVALVEIGVDLIAGHRGIHMSRLYQILMQHLMNQELDQILIQNVLTDSLGSQAGISSKSYLNIAIQLPKMTRSLKSNYLGFRSYPMNIKTTCSDNKFRFDVIFKILYSSTCPQSLRLSKEYIRENYSSLEIQNILQTQDSFWPATPHAQKSEMTVHLQMPEFSIQRLYHLIDFIESALQTPVQTSVKKADEMEFARLNGHNAMFCEDAVRKVAQKLALSYPQYGFRVETIHQESLHPHNAKSVIEHQYLKH